MRDKNGKESTIKRWVDAEGRQQIVCLFLKKYYVNFFIFFLIGNESW
jgi:hypothetical protein